MIRTPIPNLIRRRARWCGVLHTLTPNLWLYLYHKDQTNHQFRIHRNHTHKIRIHKQGVHCERKSIKG